MGTFVNYTCENMANPIEEVKLYDKERIITKAQECYNDIINKNPQFNEQVISQSWTITNTGKRTNGFMLYQKIMKLVLWDINPQVTVQ